MQFFSNFIVISVLQAKNRLTSQHKPKDKEVQETLPKQYYPFPLPKDAICEVWQESASWLQMSFENVEKRLQRTDDGCLPIL